ncbi:hypothetical protein F4808DRAFT_325794 [Astrocystis sublimbata]|nr:hypothetical protein F4808DRAFT_325794 [Astrocystis sublimbata]
MSDTDIKPVEVADPPAVEVPEDKAEDKTEILEEATATEASEVKAAEEPANESTTAENGVTKDQAEAEVADDGKPSIFRPPPGMLRVSGPRREVKFVKSDPASLAESDDPHEIRKQVEFYFGDSNLPEDKFLWEKVGGEENKPVPLTMIANFSRMRRFKPYEAVVKALKSSNFLVIEGAEGEETIRRKNAIDTDKRNKREERSIYAKGFGDESSSTQFDIEAFFTQYGQFDSVRLRRAEGLEKVFKGSVFVEWSDKDIADKFMALDPAPQWKGHPLLIMWKLDYIKQKSEAIRDGKIPASTRKFGRGANRGRGNRGNDRGGDSNDWKKRREQDQRNGFGDRRDQRGGRGRGRGRGRGNFRGRGGGRDHNDARNQDAPAKPADDGRPKIHVSKESAKALEEEKGNGKRAREDDASAAEPPAKKIDTKEESTSTT